MSFLDKKYHYIIILIFSLSFPKKREYRGIKDGLIIALENYLPFGGGVEMMVL